MKNILPITALAAILSLTANLAFAATDTPPASASAPADATKTAKAKPTSYKGTITAISASSVTVTNTTKTLTMSLSDTTKYMKDKKPAARTDFAVGDKVTGSFVKDASGTMTAHSLHKMTMAKPAAKPTTPAATTAQ